MNNIDDFKNQYEKTLDFFKQDIGSLRTGRVSPSIVESIKIESYGTFTELVQLASITSPEPHSIAIKPWDKSIIKDVEKALSNSDLNVNPVVDGDLVRLNFPPLTEESRKELVKILHKKLEESRIALRGQRDKIKDETITLEKEKQISEDERFQDLKNLDEMTKEYNEKLKEVSDNKEKEIMTI
jgi:ribosome recycling factor